MTKLYDIIVVGSGPAGIMAAKKAVEKGMSVLIIEKGRNLVKRRNLISGWFGQGLFKMDRVDLEDPLLENSNEIRNVVNFIKRVYKDKMQIIKSKELKSKYCILPAEFGVKLASYLFQIVNKKSDIIFNTEVLKIEKKDTFVIHTTKNKFMCKRCIVATGSNSIDWINYLCNSLGLRPKCGSCQVGVRVEVPTFRVLNMLKSEGNIKTENGEVITNDTRINSFVGEWEESNILSACGHALPNKCSSRTNFMVGIEADSTDVIKDIQIINVLANDKIKRERVEDYMNGKSVLKHMDSFKKLEQAFDNIEKIFPSFIGYATMYIPEIRLKGSFPVTPEMRTEIPLLYGAGECTSRVSTLIGAMASGLIVSKNILKE